MISSNYTIPCFCLGLGLVIGLGITHIINSKATAETASKIKEAATVLNAKLKSGELMTYAVNYIGITCLGVGVTLYSAAMLYAIKMLFETSIKLMTTR